MQYTVIATFLYSLVAGCTTYQTAPSDPKITNGQNVDEGRFPAVVALDSGGLCTGTFIGSTTLITAAHCVKTSPLSRTRPVAIAGRQARSNQVFVHPRWRGRVGSYDLAVVVFPPDTSATFRAISDRPPVPGDAITIVGYGKADHDNGATAGKKRFGRNTLLSRAGGELQFRGIARGDRRDGSGDGRQSASSQGDSGGPMFIDDQLVGVTSGGFSDGADKYSIYADVQAPSNLSFLKQTTAEGASIPSLEDGDTGEDSGNSHDDDLYVAIGEPDDGSTDTYTLHFGTKKDTDRVVFCESEGPSLCQGAADKNPTRRSLELTDRLIFDGLEATSLSPGKMISAVAFDTDGEIVSARTVRFISD